MAAKPKPTKQQMLKERKARKPKTKGICPQCAFIFRGMPEHFQHCSREIRPIVFRRNKTDKQMYEAALDQLCRLITIWRDGCKCVLENSGGVHCGAVSNWGHVIPQGKSTTLVYSLSNSFRQCNNHNMLHRSINAPYYDWYQETFGRLAYKELKSAWENNIGIGYNAEELRDMVICYSDLYDMRHSFSSSSIEEKVEAGYYGSIIRNAWIKEGKI